MGEKSKYNTLFYSSQISGSSGSAQQIVPIICKMVQPRSVVDFGCGLGTWLAEFTRNGVADVVGMDGDYVDRAQLLIEPSRFVAADLTKPISPARSFDLAMSLEVAEHLPPVAAVPFVESLMAHAQIVVFSAAVPQQGGTAHINEQWQHYWAELFEARGYVTIDCIRKHVWSDPKVEAFYAQNILMFVHPKVLEQSDLLRAEHQRTSREMLSVVHPVMWLYKSDPRKISVWAGLCKIPSNIYVRIRYRLQRRFRPETLPEQGYLSPAKF